MAIGENGEILGHVRTLFTFGAIGDLSDGQLLERFATDRGESAELAFAALVERHGPMVLRVCRGVLAEPHDSDDAFQATFLVLVRRARSLWVRDSLGPWLHQVAYRTASCLRTGVARRRRLERRGARSEGEYHARAGDELARVIHEELGRLPERYRAPAVLCDLEGSSHEQAARHLGWPIGTVKSRLTRAREILRDRLRRRGFGPDLGLLAAALRPRGIGALPSPALVDSTTRAVLQFVAARTIPPGSAASLAREVLRTMSITRWMKAASMLAVAAATVTGAATLAQGPGADAKPRATRIDDLPATEVRAGKLRVVVVERGSVEASRRDDVLSEIEGNTTIISIRPEGTKVKKGDIVCELDSAMLKDNLNNQQITVAQAEADSNDARLAREAADVALREYDEGTFKAERQALRGTILAARAAIKGAEARLERTRRARKRLGEILAARKGEATPADVVAELDLDDRLEDAGQLIDREKMAIEVAETRLDVLQNYTAPRTKTERTIDIQRKRADELARQATVALEKDKQTKLERQIRKCVLVAPSDGVVVYANDPGRLGNNRVQIEEGVTVRERQKIFSVVDLNDPMRVNSKVREAMVARVGRGQRARIKVDAFPGRVLTGVVQLVYPLPDATWYGDGPPMRVYTTLVRIEDAFPGLRPGMTADVEIPIVELDNVLTVPVGAVLHFDDKDHVAVRMPGGFEWREVTLGESDNASVEVKQGLKAGESVILDPAALMSEKERREKLAAPTRPAPAPGRGGRAPRER